MTTSTRQFRALTDDEIKSLESRGCFCADWSRIRICDLTNLDHIRNVHFAGDISIGANVTLINIGLLEMDADASCGVGSEVSVLDETGSRSVRIFPGLSSQLAMLMARDSEWARGAAAEVIDSHIKNYPVNRVIGDNAVIRNCISISNVAIDNEVVIDGARYLRNGSIINNAEPGNPLARIGAGVDAENFIIEDGIVESGAIVRNCFIGQGAFIEKGFTAHDSLIFANCSFENGEACALFAGPYTVSMHKSSLLIGCQTSFFNAGSGTNQSNHMYKLGPVHWGILERGVKTSSDSYIMLGAKIGAYSLVMGQHKTHPDSSDFPFSYLFGDERGSTVVDPGAMLRSCGLVRDEQKWPKRDRRAGHSLPIHDRLIFDVLNPLTIERMLRAIPIVERLLSRPADDDRFFRYKGMKFTRAALERARYLYELSVYKYLHTHTVDDGFPQPDSSEEAAEWVDVAGLLMTRRAMIEAMNKDSIEEMEKCFDKALDDYQELQRQWIGARFDNSWRKSAETIAAKADEFDRMIEDDRRKYLADLEAQTNMLRL